MNWKTIVMGVMTCGFISLHAQNTPISQMEKLDRGVVALPASSGSGNFISWRFLGTDDENRTTFDVIRNEFVVQKDLYQTNFLDKGGSSTSTYRIVTKIDGEAVDTTATVTAWGKLYKTITLDRPATGSLGGTYAPNDCSVGDVDGDGAYELFVKWYPSNAKDNSQAGDTDNCLIDCYKLDGTKLWRIDLGANIRSGAHYTQFMVYDFDGNGKAEMICKTAPGSKDNKGVYVNQVATEASIKSASNTAIYRNSRGAIGSGQEYLTVFNGQTGEAVHTVFYNPNRNMTYGGAADGSVNWGVGGKNDRGDYGNRGERYLAAVAYLGGPDAKPSGIFCRGYYDYAFIWAVDFDGKQLKQRWLSSNKNGSSYTVTTYDSEGKGTTKTYSGMKPTSGRGSGTMYQNGNHNMSIADVDGDGRDEVVWGSAACDDDGRVLYGTGMGHGDAIHLADHCPDRPGLEVFQIHESSPFGWDLHDARTGEIIHSATGSKDNGRGIAAQVDANIRGSLFWSSNDGSPRSAVTGNTVASKGGSSNFRIFWDGDLQEELLDGNKIDKWNGNGTSRIYLNGNDLYNQGGPGSTCNGSKNTPCLQADILGDWREEVILHNGSNQVAIYTTNTATSYRVPTLMHDHTYRMGICWQNTAYNQPPHLGYYLPDALNPRMIGDKELNIGEGETINWTLKWCYAKSALIAATYLPDGTKKNYTLPAGMNKTISLVDKTVTLTGTLAEKGDYTIEIKLTGMDDKRISEMLTIHVGGDTGIESVKVSQQPQQVYGLNGHQRQGLKPGLNIIRKGNKVEKIIY